MKHLKLKIALIAAMALTFGLALVGCGPSNAKYDYKVTFDYNIGNLAGDEVKNSIKNQYLGVFDNSLIVMYPKENGKDMSLQTLKGFDFDGWYLPKLENGELVLDKNGCVQTMDESVDFATYRVKSDVTLYAKFVKKHTLTVLGRTEQGKELALAKKIAYVGSVGSQKGEPFGTDAPQAAEGLYTLVEYYEDEALTKVFPFPYTFVDEDKTIYAKFLEGEWAPVNTAEGFNTALGKNQNIYVRSDIDYTGEDWYTEKESDTYDYSGTILGNGNRITNVTCNWKSSASKLTFSFFGALGESFTVRGLSFENVVLNLTVDRSNAHQVSAFASSVSEAATFESFSYSCTLNIEKTGKGMLASISRYDICKEPPASLDTQMFNVTINEK